MLSENYVPEVGKKLACDIGQYGKTVYVAFLIQEVTRKYIVAGGVKFHRDGTQVKPSGMTGLASTAWQGRQLYPITPEIREQLLRRQWLKKFEKIDPEQLSNEQLEQIMKIVERKQEHDQN